MDDCDELLPEHFSGAGVYGRESELGSLGAALDRIRGAGPGAAGEEGDAVAGDVGVGVGDAPPRSEVAIVAGPAGTGKSTLVRELSRRQCGDGIDGHCAGGADAAAPVFATGKFDQLARREPYSAIVDAFADLCRRGASAGHARAWAEDARSSMDPESRALLGRIVPDSGAVFGDDKKGLDKDGGGGGGGGGGSGDRDDLKNAEALNRLTYALRVFVRSISTSSPVRSGCGNEKEQEEEQQEEQEEEPQDSDSDSDDEFEDIIKEGRSLWKAGRRPRPPLVLFLDDLQWADETSVRIVESLITDSESRNVLFILSYRDDEVDEDRTPHLARMLRDVDTIDDRTVTRVPVGPLDVKSIGQLLADVLSLKADRAAPLADVVHRKTLGNVFFATQFLISIHREGLLKLSFPAMKWEWDVDAIVACTDIADNVVDVVAGRIGRLPRAARELLEVASCLGATFQLDVLAATRGAYASEGSATSDDIAREGESEEKKSAEQEERGQDEQDVATVLDAALREGLLEKVSMNEYKFAHDRIQQAAYSLIPKGRGRDLLHYRIGKMLWEIGGGSSSAAAAPSPPGAGQEYITFLAADQLNRAGPGCMSKDAERLAVAELNLTVAEEAMSTGAFIFAAGYLDSGVGLLDSASGGDRHEKWGLNYDLTLRLCGAAAEAQHCCANFGRCESMAREVLTNSRSLRDSLGAYFTLVECQCSDARYDDALATGFEALARLGEPFPKRPLLVIVAGQLLKTSRMLKGKTNEELLALPRMTDEDKIAAMRLMTTLWLTCVVSNKREYLLLLTFRMVQLSLRHGISDFSAVGFAVYGMITCGAISVNKGYRFGPLALELLDSSESRGAKEWSPRVTMFAYCGVKHFRTPLHECPAPFVKAYNVAMSTGDVEFGMLSALHYCMFYYFSGMSLVPLEKDMRAYCKQMREYKQETSLLPCLAYHQCVMNLMGMSENTFVLTGEAMDQEEVRKKTTEAKNIQGVTVLMLLRMQLAYYFGNTDLAKTLLRESQNLTEAFKGAHWGVVQTYFEGLVSMSIAREKKKARSRRAYLKVGQKSLKKLKSLVKCEACNCLHMYLLLKAEYVSLTGSADEEDIRKAYNAAINAAGRVGFMQDKALSNELMGKFLLAKGDESWASDYLSRAHESYLEWGAKAKADQLRRDHSALISVDRRKRRRSSVGLKSRRTFSAEAANGHRQPSHLSTATRRRSSRWSSSSGSLQSSLGEIQEALSPRRSSRWSLSSGSLRALGESEPSLCE